MQHLLSLAIGILMLAGAVNGGPFSYAACQAGCAGIVVACYSAAGFTWGTVPDAVLLATPALAACSDAYVSCQSVCAGVLVAPAP